MRNLYEVVDFQKVHNNYYFSLNKKSDEIQIQPAGQVLTDSDQLAFIYLLEEGNAYSYLQFSTQYWPQLVEIVKSGVNPFLKIDGQEIELIHFAEEMEMLLFNIEGNDNYGKPFVEAVENSFAEILKEN